jgi:outer membrane protein assembly factor BamB
VLRRRLLMAAAGLMWAWAASATASDWPQWRGPARDGISPDVPAQLPAKKLLWQRELESNSHAGLVVAGGLVIAVCYAPGEDVIQAFSTETGEPVWTFRSPNKAEPYEGSGSRATPLIHEGRVYTQSAGGEVCCLDLAKGTLVWRLDLVKEFKTKLPTYGYCASPLIAEGKLIVSPMAPEAGIAALDPQTGKTLWQTKGAGQAHSSYIVGRFGEVVQIVGYDGPSVAGWELATGRKLWSVKPEATGDFDVGTPVAVDGKVLVATDKNFARLFAFGAGGAALEKPAAVNEDLAPGMGTPVFHQNLIFGSGEDFHCVEPKELKSLWVNSKDAGLVSFTMVIAGNGRVLVLHEAGELVLLAAQGDKCQVLGRMKVCEKTWSHPALADGRLYVRDKKKLYCYALKP